MSAEIPGLGAAVAKALEELRLGRGVAPVFEKLELGGDVSQALKRMASERREPVPSLDEVSFNGIYFKDFEPLVEGYHTVAYEASVYRRDPSQSDSQIGSIVVESGNLRDVKKTLGDNIGSLQQIMHDLSPDARGATGSGTHVGTLHHSGGEQFTYRLHNTTR